MVALFVVMAFWGLTCYAVLFTWLPSAKNDIPSSGVQFSISSKWYAYPLSRVMHVTTSEVLSCSKCHSLVWANALRIGLPQCKRSRSQPLLTRARHVT